MNLKGSNNSRITDIKEIDHKNLNIMSTQGSEMKITDMSQMQSQEMKLKVGSIGNSNNGFDSNNLNTKISRVLDSSPLKNSYIGKIIHDRY